MKPWFVVDEVAGEYGKGYGTSPPGNLRKAGMASFAAETVAHYTAVTSI